METDHFDIIGAAIAEDLGAGDITTTYFVPEDCRATGRVVARERAIIAGTEAATEVFRRIDGSLCVDIVAGDGEVVDGGGAVIEVRGRARSILTAERVALNFLQRLSGIATLTHQFVEMIGNNRAQILDTRKTTPGMRRLEKAAVRAGGGTNHRFALSDMALVKDNHLLAWTGLSAVAAAVRRLREEQPRLRVELEADNLDQVRAFLEIDGIDVILLDNMSVAEMREAVALAKGKVKFEASGGVNLKTVRQIAATGVDYISVGAITHSARAIDLSLELTHVAG